MAERDWYIGGHSDDGSHVDIKAHGRGTAVCNGVPIRAAGVVVEEHNREIGQLREAYMRLDRYASSKADGERTWQRISENTATEHDADRELLKASQAEVRRLAALLSRAYPWLHNPYHGTSDVANAAEGDAVIEAVQTAIQHVPDAPDPLLSLPCASCDGDGCPNCSENEPRAALAYEYP